MEEKIAEVEIAHENETERDTLEEDYPTVANPTSIMANNEVTGNLDVSEGFNEMQPYWERFRTQIELKAKNLKEDNENKMKMKQEEIESLIKQLENTTRDYETKVTTMQREFEEHVDKIREKHKTHINSLKVRVKQTLNEEEEEKIETDNWEIGQEKSNGIGGSGTNISTKFEGDVSAEGDVFVGIQTAVKVSGEGDATGVSQLLEGFNGAAQMPAQPSRSNTSDVNVKLDGAHMSGNENVMIQNTSLKINIGRGEKGGDEESEDEDMDYENLQEKELKNRLRQWQKRSRMKDAIAFKGPNERIIELVFADKKEEYFDYLIQDVLPKLEETQLAEISPYLSTYSTIDLSQRKYNYRYLQVFFYCSPRTEFESLVMKGNHVESKDIRNLVKSLDSRQRPTHIKCIDLSDCKFDPTAFIELECLFSYTTHINLSGLTGSIVAYPNKEVTFSFEHAVQIARTVERQEQKVCVNLSRCVLNAQITRGFVPMMSKLKMLTLRYCTIDISAMSVLVEAICWSRQLKILDLCETKIEAQSFGSLAKSLGILRCLFLSSVMLREEGLTLLLEGLPHVKDGEMECLDVSFNPINQEVITRLTETVQNKIKTVVFSKEQIQLPQHKEMMIKVKRGGAKVMSIAPSHATTTENNANIEAKPDQGDEEPATSHIYSTVKADEEIEISQQQHPIESNGVETDDDFAFWVMATANEKNLNGSKWYLASISHDEIARRTLRNTWFQCSHCGTNVGFFGDKIDLLESKHFLRDQKFFGWYQNSNCVVLTRAEDDRRDQYIKDESHSLLSKLKRGIGMPSQLEAKHNCNMTCSVNGMNMRTYKCRSCKEPLGLHYYRNQQLPNQLNHFWCLLQETPGSLSVGATTKFARAVQEKKSALGKSIRDATHSIVKRKSSQVQPDDQ